MKIYSSHGINEFVICCGYKGYIIKEYFSNYFLHNCDVTFDFNQKNNMEVHNSNNEPWKVTLVDTGDKSMTGGRLKRISKYVGDESFCLTYGDGVADVDITNLIRTHNVSKKLATLTVVSPPGRFGALEIDGQSVRRFQEKPSGDSSFINGGFFIVEPKALSLIKSDSTIWETDILPLLVEQNQLSAYRHSGFWQPMDTLRDRNYLDELWNQGNAPWKSW